MRRLTWKRGLLVLEEIMGDPKEPVKPEEPVPAPAPETPEEEEDEEEAG